jgi:hypothetical protein
MEGRSVNYSYGCLDRGEAVNLARNIRGQDACVVTDKGIDTLADAVLRMDEALRSHGGSSWTPCSERLPEVPGTAMCWFQDRHAVLDYDPQCGWYWGDGSSMSKERQAEITHWMPLPSAPSATHSPVEGSKT